MGSISDDQVFRAKNIKECWTSLLNNWAYSSCWCSAFWQLCRFSFKWKGRLLGAQLGLCVLNTMCRLWVLHVASKRSSTLVPNGDCQIMLSAVSLWFLLQSTALSKRKRWGRTADGTAGRRSSCVRVRDCCEPCKQQHNTETRHTLCMLFASTNCCCCCRRVPVDGDCDCRLADRCQPHRDFQKGKQIKWMFFNEGSRLWLLPAVLMLGALIHQQDQLLLWLTTDEIK